MASPENKIVASLIEHYGVVRIRLEFPFDKDIIAEVRKIRGRKWSASMRVWLIPDTLSNRERFGLPIIGLQTDANDSQSSNQYAELCNSFLQRTKDKIILKGYSKQTLKSYVTHLKKYLEEICEQHDPSTVVKDDIEQYLLRRQQKHATSESDRNSHINAIKFLYEQVLGYDRMLFYLPRPEKPMQLPKVLGEHELERLFRSVANLKHKAILLTAFSCGLRVSEVVRLRINHIDSDRMQVFIERSKGKKDRYVTLSPVLLDVLRQYIRLQNPRPTVFLFEGQRAGDPYSVRSAQVIFQRAMKTAGIQKEVSFHTLRHSYATHLLEKGVDIRYIKDLLGHFDIKTTERYLHVAREKLVHIKSPLDYLDMGI